MPTFMGSCYCNGYRPEGIVSQRHYARPDLIAKLLRERHVARFVVAPTGFGKSSLAFEYAEVVFSFQHVFWMNGRSPCFLRDLDEGVLLRDLIATDRSPRLVVCEDIPPFDSNRSQAFGQFIDTLLERGIEVFVTCVPSADSLACLQRDRVYVSGADLLLSDDEMLAEEVGGRLRKGWDAPDAHVGRVACMRWGQDDTKSLLNGLKNEELSGDMRLAMLVLFVLGQGSVDDVSLFVSAERIDEIISILEHDYPLFGIKTRMRTYHAIEVETDVLAETFCPRIEDLVTSSRLSGRDMLCNHIANILVARGNASRACAFLRAFSAKPASASWLAYNGWNILALNAPQPFCDLYEAVHRSATDVRDTVNAQRAWAMYLLDDVSSALTLSKHIIQSASPATEDCLSALVLLVRKSGNEAKEQVQSMLKRFIKDGFLKDGEMLSSLHDNSSKSSLAIDWMCVAQIVCALSSNIAAGVQAWKRQYNKFAHAASQLQGAQRNGSDMRTALLMSASWILDDIVAFCGREDSRSLESEQNRQTAEGDEQLCMTLDACSLAVSDLETLTDFIVDELHKEISCGELRLFTFLAGASLEYMIELFPHLTSCRLTVSDVTAIHRVQIALWEQIDKYRQHNNTQSEEQRAFRSTHPDEFRPDVPTVSHGALSSAGIPTLHVTLFGSDEVRIGNRVIDQSQLSRRKARVMLAILVLNHGREVPRDRLATSLWPESRLEVARKNVHSVWSHLKRALNLENEQGCPYLIRSRSGCRIDMRFVSSDVFVFEDLCRSLLFGVAGSDGWERLYAQVCEDYAEELMPSEHKNEIIVSLRHRYGMQLIDALIAASTRLRTQGEPRGSLWFAREALRRDKTREDAYVALMEAQIASNQRSSALETYFSCRRFLSDELGIDPSTRIVELYRSVIETEESLT